MTQRWRLGILVAVLLALIVWAWVTDRAGPAYPHGQFGSLMGGAVMLVAVVGLGGLVWRELRSPASPRRDEKSEHDNPA